MRDRYCMLVVGGDASQTRSLDAQKIDSCLGLVIDTLFALRSLLARTECLPLYSTPGSPLVATQLVTWHWIQSGLSDLLFTVVISIEPIPTMASYRDCSGICATKE